MTLRRRPLTRAILALAGRIVALTGVLVLAASSMLGASILCVGAEGHISLESLDRDCCAEELSSESAQSVPSIRPADPCGPCVDFTLQADTVPMRSAQVEAAVPAAATMTKATSAFASCLALPLAVGLTPRDSARHAGSSAPPRSSVALTRLQGVLLRC